MLQRAVTFIMSGVLGMSMMLACAWAADAPRWSVAMDQSEIAIAFTQYGTPVEGRFESWAADIHFDPDHLAGSKAVVTVDLESLKTGDASRDATAQEKAWLDTDTSPAARFETTGFTATGAGAHEAAAMLTLKGADVAITLPFTLEITGDTARMSGTVDLDRAAFGIGDPGTVSEAVTVSVSVTATRLSP